MRFTFLNRFASGIALAGSAAILLAGSAHAMTATEVAALKGPDRQAKLEACAKQEGKVTWYTTLIIDQAARPLAQAFEKKHPGVKVQIYRATGDALLQKWLAEARANHVVASVDEELGIDYAAQRAGLILPFHSPSADTMSASRKDAKGYWAASRMNYFGLSYNTNLVKPADKPKKLEDVLDPKWKNKLVWNSELVGAPLEITAWRKYMGEEKALDFLTKLSKQNVAVVDASSRVTVNRVMAGEYAMSLDAFLHHPLISKQKGAPVDSIPLNPVTTINGSVLYPKNSPQPCAGMLLLDYIISKEGQQILAKAHYFPGRDDVPPADFLKGVLPSAIGMKENVLTPEEVAKENQKSQEIFSRLFR
jgi:iron(III) transport system substrate-binding protein